MVASVLCRGYYAFTEDDHPCVKRIRGFVNLKLLPPNTEEIIHVEENPDPDLAICLYKSEQFQNSLSVMD